MAGPSSLARPVALLACVAVLSGCFGLSGGGEPSDGAPLDASGTLGTVLADLTSTDCQYNDLIWAVPRAQAQALLPPGFEARTFGSEDVGAIVVNTFDCAGGPFAWNGWDMFVFAQTPVLPDIVESFDAENRVPRDAPGLYLLDLYMVAAHTDHEGLAGVFAAAGMPVGPGSHARVDASAGPGGVALLSLEAAGEVLGTAVLPAVHQPGVVGAMLLPHHRQWRVTEEGTVLVERVMTHGGGAIEVIQAPGACHLAASTVFHDVVGPQPCTLTQDAIGGMEWSGRAYLFPGVAPVAA